MYCTCSHATGCECQLKRDARKLPAFFRNHGAQLRHYTTPLLAIHEYTFQQPYRAAQLIGCYQQHPEKGYIEHSYRVLHDGTTQYIRSRRVAGVPALGISQG